MTHAMPSDNVETPAKVTIIIDGAQGTTRQEFWALPSNISHHIRQIPDEDPNEFLLGPPQVIRSRTIDRVDVMWGFEDLIRQPENGNYLVTDTSRRDDGRA